MVAIAVVAASLETVSELTLVVVAPPEPLGLVVMTASDRELDKEIALVLVSLVLCSERRRGKNQ
ncbi:MAG: hypothetical protein O2968_01835 [Acidobacteria bacterium]|nr:hypothetical protein [Acidobacteriota bacterium]